MSLPKSNHPTESVPFQIKHSLIVLWVAFFAGSFFAVLLCFYPGPEFLGGNFWAIFALFAILALGALLKIIFRKPILQIDNRGIHFYNSKTFIPWSRVRFAGLMAVAQDGDKENAKNFFVVQFIDEKGLEILEIDFSVTGMMNKTEAELEAALAQFYVRG